ncbi:MAG: protein phosphatase 2C domain-containing protein [Eubacteriales bacterium]
MPRRIYQVSRKGAHPVNQDSARTAQVGEATLLMVSDGVGSKKYSEVGSQSICNAAQTLLSQKEILPTETKATKKEVESYLTELHTLWKQGLEGRSPKDCGATALIAVIYPEQTHLFRLGDGFLCAVTSRESILLTDGEEGFINTTNCLHEELEIDLWEYQSCQTKGLRGVIACSDGVKLEKPEQFSRDFLNAVFYDTPATIEKIITDTIDYQTNSDDKTMTVYLAEIDVWEQHIAVQERENFDVYDANGQIHHCTQMISQGGQGAVYRTTTPNIAIKFEFSEGTRTRDSRNIDRNKMFAAIRRLPIPEHCEVTLPLVPLQDYVGYVMELLEDMDSFTTCFSLGGGIYRGGNPFFDSLLPMRKGIPPTPQERMVSHFYKYQLTGGKRRRLLAYYKLATLFAGLHSRGLVFGDLSPNNVFLSRELDYTNVWLIDVDNLSYQEQAKRVCTPGVVAPEVWTRSAPCSFYSDDYSFALALFAQLTGSHPFHGALYHGEEDLEESMIDPYAENRQDQMRDSGEFPWIYDKQDPSNDCNNTILPVNYILSKGLMDTFDTCFCEKGRRSRTSRPSAMQWIAMIAQELDHTISCPHCHMESVWEEGQDTLQDPHTYWNNQPPTPNPDRHCPWCGKSIPVVTVRSYPCNKRGVKQGEPIWFYVSEWREQITLPLRLFTGPRVRTEAGQEGEIFGQITHKNHKEAPNEHPPQLTLSQFHSDYNIQLQEEDGSFRSDARKFKRSASALNILCTDRKEKQYYLLELEITNQKAPK